MNEQVSIAKLAATAQVLGTLQESIPLSGPFQMPQVGRSVGFVLNVPWDLR